MDPRLQRRVQRYGWDKAASHYERFWQEQLAPAQRRLLEMADLLPAEHVLDVACGTGLVTYPAAEAIGPAGLVLATDISEAMIARVIAEARARGLDQVRAERLEAESLVLDDQTFDAALCALGLMYVPDPLKALEEMWRVLKPRARIVVAVWGRRDRCGWAEIFPIVDRQVASEVCPMFFQLGTGEALRLSMERAGFEDLLVQRLSVTLTYGSDQDACGAAFDGGPVALAYSRFDGPTREAVHLEYLQSIAPWRDGEGYQVPGEFVIARGRRTE